MRQQISKKIFIYLFLFIVFGTVNNLNLNKENFPNINTINIKGLKDDEKLIILNGLRFVKFENIFFSNSEKIKEFLNSNNFVENYSVFKKYPSTLEIKIKKTKILANVIKDGLNYQIGSNGKLIKEKNINKNIPSIFGDFNEKKFLKLKKLIDNSPLIFENVEKFYYFNSGRWDLEMKSGILIKLPQKQIKKALDLIDIFLKESKDENIKIIDIRVDNQIIING